MVNAPSSIQRAYLLVLASHTKRTLRFLSVLLALSAGVAARAEAGVGAEIDALLHGMFDKPELTLKVSPIVIAGDFAIVDWTQGEMGGRALLRRKQGAWMLTLCAGDGIRSREALKRAGVPQQETIALEQALTAAEAKLDPQQVTKYSRFEGMVLMDGASTQPHEPQRQSNPSLRAISVDLDAAAD